MSITDILIKATSIDASDIFVIAGAPISFKIGGVIERVDNKLLKPQDTRELSSDW